MTWGVSEHNAGNVKVRSKICVQLRQRRERPKGSQSLAACALGAAGSGVCQVCKASSIPG